MFDELRNKDLVDLVWKTIEFCKSNKPNLKKEELASECCNNLIKLAMLKESEDNLSVIVVFLKDVFK